MSPLKRLPVMCLALVAVGIGSQSLFAQTSYISRSQQGTRSAWMQRVLNRSADQGRVVSSGTPVHTVSQGDAEIILPPEGEMQGEYFSEGEIIGPIVDDGMMEGDVIMEGPISGSACGPQRACTVHEACGPGMDEDCYYYRPFLPFLRSGWYRNLEVSIGAQGFKGPADMGRNGNFGFQEGLNWGAPLGDPWGFGYQAGFRVVHSSFPGSAAVSAVDPTATYTANRTQFFFTTGLFRRPEHSRLQWGVVFDWMHDSYYDDADVKQIRNELSLWLDDRREIGYFGAYGVGSGELSVDGLQQRLTTPLEPTDLFAVFYRRHFSGGGEGRFWVGASGNGDALLGANATIPIGTSWALENAVTYLSPEEGTGVDGQKEEHWAVAIRLVWYPGRSSVEAINSPFRPVLGVADNTVFLTDTPGFGP